VRRIPSFVYGHVLGALVIGVVAGAFLDLKAVLIFGGVMGASAIASAFICWLWPGLTGPGWQLWIVGVIGSPLFLVAAFFAYQDYDCLLGNKTGWNCMFADVGPLAMGVCLGPPLFGLTVRWLASRSKA
jgi:hypothetical protein